MMTLYQIIFLTFCIGSPKSGEIEEKRIITKFCVMDENFSPKWYFCDKPPVEFLIMDDQSCSFILDNMEFDINQKWTLDSLGRLNEYWDYRPMGPLVYKRSDFDTDQKLKEYIGADNINIQVLGSGDYIYDSGDTLEIEKVFKNEKLLFVKRSPEMKNIRIIYQYQ